MDKEKNNLPAFLFYANDFVGSTAHYEVETVGAYIRLLCFQWVNGTIPKKPKQLQGIISCSEEKFKEIWGDLSDKFLPFEGGYQNKRLEAIRQEAVAYRESCSERGKEGAKARWQGHSPSNAQAMANTMPKNGLSSSSSSSSPISSPISKRERQRFAPPALPEVIAFWGEGGKEGVPLKGTPESFFNYFSSNGWRVGRAGLPMKDWHAAARNWAERESGFFAPRKGDDTSQQTIDRIKATVEKYGGK